MTSSGLRYLDFRRGSREEQQGDLLLAGGIGCVAVAEAVFRQPVAHRGGLLLLALTYSLTLLWRRRYPRLVLLINQSAGIAIVGAVKQGGLVSFVLAALLASFTVGRLCDRPTTYWAPAIILGEGWTYYAIDGGQLSDFVFIALLYGGAWLVGLALREREQRIHDLVAEAATLRAETDLRAQLAVAAERRWIARELHDLVSHSISVMAVQTQMVRLRLPADQVQDKRDLTAVEATARQALSEMRRMLGVLRDSDTTIELAPTPGLSRLDALLAEHESTTGPVRQAVSGQPRTLPSGVDLAAYRIVQEALTNTRKH